MAASHGTNNSKEHAYFSVRILDQIEVHVYDTYIPQCSESEAAMSMTSD